jgi:hypothetical protein
MCVTAREDALTASRIALHLSVFSMKTKITPELEPGQRSKRKAYRKARKRGLARLQQGVDLRWTPARSRDELHDRNAPQYP